MSLTRLVIQAAILAGIIGASARGDAILTLGMFSGAPSAPTTVTSFPLSSGTSYNLANTDPTNQTALSFLPSTSFATSSPVASTTPGYDAFINLGTGPYANASTLTTGNAQPWYDSSKILSVFGGQPTSQQIVAFDNTILQRVQQSFQISGVPITLTDNPNAPAAHTLSVVSNTTNPQMGNAIGMTNLGGNGFHFIDNSASYATSVDQLEWIVAHNVAHELMLAFGVPEVHDQTGHYIDSTVGSMAMFLNPQATFSPGAVQDLLSRNFLQSGNSFGLIEAQLVGGAAVPEPATLAIWGLGAIALLAARRARSTRVLGKSSAWIA